MDLSQLLARAAFCYLVIGLINAVRIAKRHIDGVEQGPRRACRKLPSPEKVGGSVGLPLAQMAAGILVWPRDIFKIFADATGRQLTEGEAAKAADPGDSTRQGQ